MNTIEVSTTANTFNPMQGRVSETQGGLPAGNYTGVFSGATYEPAKEPDAMTGKGGKQWPTIRFSWRVVGGPNDGAEAVVESSDKTGPKSGYTKVCGWLMGRTLSPGDAIDLTAAVGKRYLLTVSPKLNTAGQPTGWTTVSAAIALPQ